MSSENVSKLWKLGIGVLDDPQIWCRMPVHILEKEILRCLAASYPTVIKFSLVCRRWRTLLHHEYYSRIRRASSLADPEGQGWFLQLFLVGQTRELFAALHHPKLDLWQQLPIQSCTGCVRASYLVMRLDFVKADKGMLLLKKSYVEIGDRAKVQEEEWVVIGSLTRLDNRQTMEDIPSPTRIPDMGWNITEANIFFTVSRSEEKGCSATYKIIILAVDKYVNWFVSQVYDSSKKKWEIVNVARLDETRFQDSLIWSLFCGVLCNGLLYLVIFPPDSYDRYFVLAYDINRNGAPAEIPVPTDEMPLQNGTLRMSFCHLVECGGQILLLLDYINGSNDPFERWHDSEGIGIWELEANAMSGAKDHWVKRDTVTREQMQTMDCHRDFLRHATFVGVGHFIYIYCWNHTINQSRSVLIYDVATKSWTWLSHLPNLGFQSQISFCHSAIHL